MMRRGAVRAVIAALILCAMLAAARADEFTELAAAATTEIYLYAPALTRETCKALVAADARHVLIFLVVQPSKGWACDAHTATLTTVYTLEHISSAFVFFDYRQVGEGPDIEHLTFKYDPARAEYLMHDFWDAALKSPEMAALKKRNQGDVP
jgi:hypothetical protein